MNLVGKIITVLLFLMSLMFLGLAVLSFATGQNYKELVEGVDDTPPLSTTLREARTTLEAREGKFNELKLRLAHEQASRRSALAALEVKSQELSAGLKTQKEQFDALLSTHKTNIELISTSQSTIGGLKDEVDAARAKLDEDFKRRDAVLKEITETTDKLNQGEAQLRRLKERGDQLRRGN